MNRCIVIIVLLLCTAAGCRKQADAPAGGEIAVTSSYLHAAVRDVAGDDVSVFCMVPPGMCPGHFDLRPSEAQRLLRAKRVVAFDFQRGIGQLLPTDGRGPTLHTVDAPPGLCIPSTYLKVVNQTAVILSVAFPDRAAAFAQRVDSIAERMTALEAECAAVIETHHLRGASVLASPHQAVFAEWLGLEVVATFAGREAETAANLNAAIQNAQRQPLRCLVANQQEGTQLADALAQRLAVPVAMFSNFPNALSDSTDAPAFDTLIRDNLRQLIEVTR